MTNEKNPVDKAVELFVFAPLGLALSARELLPDLIEKGRQQVTGQVNMARMIGQFAVQQGQVEAGKALGKAREQAVETLETIARGPGGGGARPASPPAPPAERTTASPTAPTTSATATATVVEGAPAPARTSPASPPPAPAPAAPAASAASAPPEPEPAAPAPAVGSLAIPDYESLSASQVVPRLSGLSGDELEAVRAYEAANRGRKTILNKVAQLQGA